MAAVKPLAGQLDISDIADAIASDPGATALLGASFLELAGGTMTGDLTVEGTIVGDKDNATALRVRGLQHVSEGVADVQSYSGIFTNAGYTDVGTLNTRFITGGNLEMDVVVISPHQLQLVAVDGTQTDGQVYVSSQNDVVFDMRNDPETNAPNRLIFDRVSKVSTGAANTSDVEISVSAGNLNIVPFVDFGSGLGAVGGITAGTWFRGGEGSAAAPGVAFTSDTTSGMWQGTTNAVDFASNGINRFRVASDGTLEVKTTDYELLVLADDDVPNKKYVDDGLAVHTGDATIHFTEASISHVNIADNGSNSHATIDTHLGDGSIHSTLNDAGTGLTEVWSASKLDADFGGKVDVGGDTMTGDLTMEADVIMDNAATTQLFLADGSLVNPSQAFQTDPNTGVWWPGIDMYEIVTGGLARLRVAANGLITARTAAYDTLVFGNANALPNLAYIDANYLNLGGGTLTGALNVSAGTLTVGGGNINVTLGDVTVAAGGITATLGSVTAGTGVTAGTWFRGGEGSPAVPSYAFTVGGTSGMYQNNTDEVDFSTAGLPRFTIGSDGTLEVNTVNYETLVTADDDVPNKKFVDDEIAGAPFVPVVAPSIALLPATPKVGLGPLGPGAAVHPPGAFAFVTDDASAGPTAFTMAVVDPSPGWVRVDLPAVYIV